MAKYDVRVRYAFEGTYKVVAEDRDEAERIVTEDCGLVLGGNIHTTRNPFYNREQRLLRNIK